MSKRFEIHSHSEYSNIRLLDSINKIKDLVDRAIDLGLSGICLTDHECLSGHPEANFYADEIHKKYPDFKVGLGNEIYLNADREKGQKYYHFILIAKNKLGHKALRELSSRAWMNSFWDRGLERVVTTYDDLEEIVKKYPNTLIATTACLGGQVSSQAVELTKAEKHEDAAAATEYHNNIIKFILWCKSLFGEDFYIECAPGRSTEQIIANKRLKNIAKAFNCKMVLGCDAHYGKREDRYVHKAYLNSKNGEREVDDFYEYAYLQTEEEIKNNIEPSELDYDTLVTNSEEIYNKIENYSLRHKQTIPKVEVINYPKAKDYNPGFSINDDIDIKKYPTLYYMLNSDNKHERYWINQCLDKLVEKGLYNKTYLERLEEEADIKKVISEKLETNMFSYPITLQHYINLFWECGSTVGAGRGSACSGLNHYLLNITQLNPVQWNLPFWRYLNKERAEIGDVDLDICPSKRPVILQKIKEERGQKFNSNVDELSRKNLGCTLIATFGTEETKQAVLTSCFKKGTLIDTIDGEKPIEEIKSGDIIKTLDDFETVITPTHTIGIPNYQIKTKNYVNKNFICTEDHEILTIQRDKKNQGKDISDKVKNFFPEIKNYSSLSSTYDLYVRNFREVNPIWKPAKDIKDNKDFGLTFIDTTIEQNSHIHWTNDFKQKFGIGISENIEINSDFCELIGIWLAEGSINRASNQISFTIHQKEETLKNRIVELMWKVFQLNNVCITKRLTSKAMTISYSSYQLVQFFFELFDNTGIWKEKKADNTYHYLTQWDKKVPSKLMFIEPQLQLQIVKGLFLGDGYASSNPRNAKITTVSKQLAKDMIFILHRNFLNPSVDIEERSLTSTNKCDCYNLTFYGDLSQVFYNIKYANTDFSTPLEIPINARRSIDIPVMYNNKLYMKAKLKIEKINATEEEVFCLKMPHQNFDVNNLCVHNCRGYRSKDYPDGIDVDTAQYLSSLIPSERGKLWSLNDVVYGNEDKNRKPVTTFINEMNQYPGLLDIALAIEGIKNKRSSHASGVILFDEDPYEFGCFMRTRKGEIITQYDLHMDEAVGLTKYDFLVTDIQDKIVQTIRLLQKYDKIDKNLSLKQVYDKYLHPEVLPIENPNIWKAIQKNEILNMFQFDSDVGSQAIKKVQPSNILELTDANGLLRLMASDKNAEQPLDKYIRYKNNISLWYKEMDNAGLTKEEQRIVEPYFKSSYGVPPSQEQLMRMLMDENICGFSLKEANDARKIVAKKQLSRIPELHKKILDKAASPALGEYIWEKGAGPQMGYSFSIIHSLAYSFIGVQTVFLATQWNPIFWNTACLIVNSSSLETKEELDDDNDNEIEDNENAAAAASKSTDYAKIAKALGDIISRGIKVSLIDINESGYTFEPNEIDNEILFGLKAVNKIGGQQTINQIIDNRPYTGIKDFMMRCPLNKTQMVSLIKAGAFDKLDNNWASQICHNNPRYAIMGYYLSLACEPKKRLTLQNFNGLIKNDLIPNSLKRQKTLFAFNKYLRANMKKDKYYMLDNECLKIYLKYFNANNNSDLNEINVINGTSYILQSYWDKLYKREMDDARDWLKENQEEVLKQYNALLFNEAWNKYATGNISAWEMESLCFYYHAHELAHINNDKYGIVNFFDLSYNPEVDYFYRRNNRDIPIFKLYKIAGTIISKNNVKSSISILTPNGNGVVTVKFTKEYFAMYNRQISEIQSDGSKKVLEKGWFSRGTKVMITGYRREDTFVAKTYARTVGHQLYKITDVKPNGDLVIIHDRAIIQ